MLGYTLHVSFELTHPGPETIMAQARVDQFVKVKARTAFGRAHALLGETIRRPGDGYRIGLGIRRTRDQAHEAPQRDESSPALGGVSNVDIGGNSAL